MEIMLAVLILGIVITTVLASFHTVFSTTTTLNNSANYYDMAKTCLNRVTLDLEGLYVSQPPLYKPPEFDNPPDPYRFLGTESNFAGTSFAKLRFTSRAHILFEKSTRNGIAEIVYYVTAKNDGQLVLKRADHLYPYPPFAEKGSDPVLCENVKSLAFRYYDAEGSELESWDSDSGEYGHRTPRTIAVQLEIGNESESYVFATRIRLPVYRDKHG
jgi:general secretion pathway protein J